MATIIQRAMLQVETAGRKATSQSEPRPCCTIDLSKSRANDAALRILRAYKLTGNFHVNLEIILKHLGAVGDVICEVAPMSTLPCRLGQITKAQRRSELETRCSIGMR